MKRNRVYCYATKFSEEASKVMADRTEALLNGTRFSHPAFSVMIKIEAIGLAIFVSWEIEKSRPSRAMRPGPTEPGMSAVVVLDCGEAGAGTLISVASS